MFYIPFSRKTFGAGMRTEGLCRHLEKEIAEVRAKPNDVKEWIDIIILGLDGAWRCLYYGSWCRLRFGSTPVPLVTVTKKLAEVTTDALLAKTSENMFERNWPPPGPEDVPTEHIRV
jgi:hypothetical protein